MKKFYSYLRIDMVVSAVMVMLLAVTAGLTWSEMAMGAFLVIWLKGLIFSLIYVVLEYKNELKNED